MKDVDEFDMIYLILYCRVNPHIEADGMMGSDAYNTIGIPSIVTCVNDGAYICEHRGSPQNRCFLI